MGQIHTKDHRLGFFEALAMMTSVAAASDYRIWTLEEIELYLVPALKVGQCKIYLDDKSHPTAFFTWAMVDDACHAHLLQSGRNPPPDRWASGHNLWIMDVVAPFGSALHVVRDIQRNHYPHHPAYTIRRNPDGTIKRIDCWRSKPPPRSGRRGH